MFLLVGYGILTEGAHKAAEEEYDGADLCDGEAHVRVHTVHTYIHVCLIPISIGRFTHYANIVEVFE